METFLWVEKYRPTTIDACILPNSLKGSFSEFVKDKKNDTANNYSLDVDVEGQGDYNFYFKVENLKLMPLTYDVKVSSKNISHFKSQTSNAVEYWIALEPESSYSE